jgi:hypothetical protein
VVLVVEDEFQERLSRSSRRATELREGPRTERLGDAEEDGGGLGLGHVADDRALNQEVGEELAEVRLKT